MNCFPPLIDSVEQMEIAREISLREVGERASSFDFTIAYR